MSLHDNFNKIHRISDKNDLVQYIETRFTTSFIGSLASIEDHLAELFSEDDWNHYWQPLREEILNKANAQKRLAVNELKKYEHRKITKVDKQVKDHIDNYPTERNFNQ
jgi:hypothetical protein